MPSKNVQRDFKPNTFHHVYNRGVEKRDIFLDDQDRRVFLSLFDRYLNPFASITDKDGITYPNFSNVIEMQCYCLMNNHFHILIWVGDNPKALSELMRSFSTSYVGYFNKKYSRVGSLFQGKFKSNEIETGEQLLHTSRYIHLNPKDPLHYKYSSAISFIGSINDQETFLNSKKLRQEIGSLNYREFLTSQIEK